MNIFTTLFFFMARYGLFVLKVPLNPNQPTCDCNSGRTEQAIK